MKKSILKYRSELLVNRTSRNRQSGLSLVELLIAMIIGLFLLAGITSSYLSSKKTSILRDQYSQMEDNGRMALEILTNTLAHTGYTSSKGVPLEDKFISVAADILSTNCGVNQSVMDTSIFPTNVTIDSATGDGIGTIHLGDNNVFTDCAGGVLPAECRLETGTIDTARIYNTFYLDKVNNTLMCAGSRTNAVELIAEGIENMQILYGVDENADNVSDRYVREADVNGLWNTVVSIQIAVLARSLNEVKNQAESKKFTMLNVQHTTPNDRYQRAVFSATISLRNTLN